MIQFADLKEFCEGTLLSVLPDEVEGLVTSFLALSADQVYQATPKEDTGLVYLFTDGMGRVEQGVNSWQITEIALFVPLSREPFKITAGNERLDVLELAVAFSAEDRELFDEHKHKIPSFQTCSSCGIYKERMQECQDDKPHAASGVHFSPALHWLGRDDWTGPGCRSPASDVGTALLWAQR